MPKHGTSTRKEQSRRYYQKHRNEIRAKRKATRESGDRGRAERARKADIRLRLSKIKASTPCTDCGIAYPGYIMDFDHVRGKKTMAVAQLVGRGYSWDQILDEKAKCEIVCSNCHRERTHERLELDSVSQM
jgi:hypothetical protein